MDIAAIEIDQSLTDQAREQLKLSRKPVVFSIYEKNFDGSGPPSVMNIPQTGIKSQNPANLWIGDNSYIIPRSGYYSITIDFMVDSYPDGFSKDDAYIVLSAQDFDTKKNRELMRVWSGEQPEKTRTSVSGTVIEELNALDALTLVSRVYGDDDRRFRDIRLSLHELR